MKTIKLLIAIFLFSPLFIACEADSVENEDVSLENVDVFSTEDDNTVPPRGNSTGGN